MARATLTSKGQVTIPKEVRLRLGISTGDRLEFLFDADGTVTLRPRRKNRFEDVFGLLKRPGQRPLTVEEMSQSVGRYHAGRSAGASRRRPGTGR